MIDLSLCHHIRTEPKPATQPGLVLLLPSTAQGPDRKFTPTSRRPTCPLRSVRTQTTNGLSLCRRHEPSHRRVASLCREPMKTTPCP
ncbi:hypothetical protein M0R45_005026 [Rubus argutus]|uniref:Uncharacterized protein n=1 Tax=Rubus argutus TaxID=59490 RepID=A0AAW1YLI7_RUBAR